MSTTGPLVSVIVPVFNGERHLRQCLASLTSQSYWNLEIIVINDGSTDGTACLLRSAEQQDARIIAVDTANGGVSRARNTGLERARGEWIMFVDADDMLSDRQLIEAVVLVACDATELISFACSSEQPEQESAYPPGCQAGEAAAGEAGRVRMRGILAETQDVVLDGAGLAEMVAAETLNALWDKAYRRDLIRRRGCRFAEGTRMGEDLLFNLGYITAGTALRKLPVTGYFYRRDNAASATSRYLPQKHADLMRVSDSLLQWALGEGSPALRAAAEYIRAKNVVSCIRDLHHPDCGLSRRERVAAARLYRSSAPSANAHGIGVKRRAFGSFYNVLGARTLLHLTRLLATP